MYSSGVFTWSDTLINISTMSLSLCVFENFEGELDSEIPSADLSICQSYSELRTSLINRHRAPLPSSALHLCLSALDACLSHMCS